MNKLMPYLVKILFFIFVLAVGIGIISMSFNALGRIFPNDLFDQAIGLVLFDIAALTWFLVLAYNSDSTMQYVFAALGFLTGLLGTFGLIGIEVGISSGMLVAAEMTRPLTYVFIAVFAGHLSLIYAFHSSAPHMNAKISLGIDKAKIVDEGQKQAEKELAKQMPQLGATIAARLVAEVMKDLNLTPARGHVLDMPALPVENVKDSPAPAVAMNGAGFIRDWILNRGAKKRKYEQVVTKVQPSYSPAPSSAAPRVEVEEQAPRMVEQPVGAATFNSGMKSFEFTLNAPRWWQGHEFYGMVDMIPAQRYEVRLPDEPNGWGGLYNNNNVSLGNLTPDEWGALKAGRLPATWLEHEPKRPDWYVPDAEEQEGAHVADNASFLEGEETTKS